MKFCLCSTIAKYSLLALLFFTLYTYASQKKKENILSSKETNLSQNHGCCYDHEKRTKVCTQKWKTLYRLLLNKKNEQQNNKLTQDLPQTLQAPTKIHAEIITIPELCIFQNYQQLFQNSLLFESKNRIFSLIMNKLLKHKEIIVLQKTCKAFQHFLQPNQANMITFCNNYGDSKKMTDTTVILENVILNFCFLRSPLRKCIYWRLLKD